MREISSVHSVSLLASRSVETLEEQLERVSVQVSGVERTLHRWGGGLALLLAMAAILPRILDALTGR
jgi:hypothetical protein